jgi:hypothetical protein
MCTAEQYRAKAIEYSKLVGTASGAGELREFERLERSFAEPAENTQSVTGPRDQMMRAREHAAGPSRQWSTPVFVHGLRRSYSDDSVRRCGANTP